MDFTEKDGYLTGSYVTYGYVAIVNGFTNEIQDYVFKDGTKGKTVVYPLHMIPSNERMLIFKNYQSNNKFYDTTGYGKSFHLVQFSRSGGLFSSESEADQAVKMHLSYLNETNKKANKETYTYEDLKVEIKKIRFECSMKMES